MTGLNVTICDPGLFSMGAHGFNYALALSHALRRRGHGVSIYAYRYADAGVLAATGATPHFKHLLYDRVDDAKPFDEELNWSVLNASFAEDMHALGDAVLGAERIVLLPNITQHQIHGLADWYKSTPDEQRPALVVNLMFYPRWTAWADHAVRGAEFYLRAADMLRPWLGRKVGLCTENIDIADFYTELLGARVALAPVPLESPARLTPSDAARPLRFGFFGYSKCEKGFHLLPEAIALARRRGARFRALVQIHHHHAEPEIVAADKALSAMRDIDVMRGTTERAQYYALLDSCDVILLPYDPIQYRTRGSSVLAEAVSYAKPVVATRDTWAALAAKRGECAAVLCDFDPGSLAAALLNAEQTLSFLSATAATTASHWLAANNVDVYCSMIERYGGLNGRNTALPAAAPALDSAFPRWPDQQAVPLPRPGCHYPQMCAGVQWDGSTAVIAGDEALIGFMTPAGAPSGTVRLDVSSSGGAAFEATLNGWTAGVIEAARTTTPSRLPFHGGSIGPSTPCALRLRRTRGEQPMLISAVRMENEQRRAEAP